MMRKRNSAEVAFRSLSFATPARAPGIVVEPLPWRPWSTRATTIGLIVADLAALAGCAALFLRNASDSNALIIAALGWLVVRYFADLYEPIMLAPPDEVRRSFYTTVGALSAHLGVLYLVGLIDKEWAAVVACWATLLVLPWGTRQLAKLALMRVRLYGAPVVVVGAGAAGHALVEELHHNREQGLHPVALFDDSSALRGKVIEGVPVVGKVDDAADYEFPYPVEHALIALEGDDAFQLRETSSRFAARFAHVHVTPEFVGLANLWVQPRAIGPLLTFEFRQDRLTPFALGVKRVFDVLLGTLFFVLAAPIIGLCALLVKLTSPGPAFFSQVREGYRGRLVRVWKIRTMVVDAEQRLEEHLKENSAARRQWAERVKLEADPRVIPGLGRFLRQWSLDELPQLWNVVTGSMSLVGPRPFPDYHLSMFPNDFRVLRRQVPPGITGLWQVTYRTDGDLTHQRAADSYYVHNWSVWLDLWILLRTVRVVFSGSGA